MELSKRLAAVASLVTRGNALVDVGTDHAYLPVWLVLNGICPKAVAMDVKKGPLERARQHIAGYHLSEQIGTRLSDGLIALTPEKRGDMPWDGPWTLVIAGMGGPLMERILTQGRSALPLFTEAVLQPQSDLPHFRRFLKKENYCVTQEKMILEEGKFYPMMKVAFPPGVSLTGSCTRDPEESLRQYEDSSYTEDELFGPFLLSERNDILRQYLERESRICAGIMENLSHTDSEAGARRREEILRYQRQISSALTRFRDPEPDP